MGDEVYIRRAGKAPEAETKFLENPIQWMDEAITPIKMTLDRNPWDYAAQKITALSTLALGYWYRSRSTKVANKTLEARFVKACAEKGGVQPGNNQAELQSQLREKSTYRGWLKWTAPFKPRIPKWFPFGGGKLIGSFSLPFSTNFTRFRWGGGAWLETFPFNVVRAVLSKIPFINRFDFIRNPTYQKWINEIVGGAENTEINCGEKPAKPVVVDAALAAELEKALPESEDESAVTPAAAPEAEAPAGLTTPESERATFGMLHYIDVQPGELVSTKIAGLPISASARANAFANAGSSLELAPNTYGYTTPMVVPVAAVSTVALPTSSKVLDFFRISFRTFIGAN